MVRNKLSYAIIGIISMIISLATLRSILLSTPGSVFYFLNSGLLSNIIAYLSTGLLFITLFITLSLLVKYGKIPDLKISSRVKYVFLFLMLIATACVGYLFYEMLFDTEYYFEPIYNTTTIVRDFFFLFLVWTYSPIWLLIIYSIKSWSATT